MQVFLVIQSFGIYIGDLESEIVYVFHAEQVQNTIAN